ncbi:hypothetical protein J7T55_007831 [Diaporthe amygdali]|uniref:uncharacterized protein n=1 Tax=Phomopsis amygdali TaxID=1214568 RepID=UPI0022FE18EB|nr:uncharacterized protein J7T55_007831 [Diaporthe amygdali]KAJ0107640.1 hypothetical protein J7T55_007831 [Diaporthe amygdali]
MKIPLSAILPGQASEACCTCATVLSDVPRYSPQTEKPYPGDRRLECCSRVICGRCIHDNARFASYCPYCQIASEPSNPLPQGLREPPSYDTATAKTAPRTPATPDNNDDAAPPPPYKPSTTHSSSPTSYPSDEKSSNDDDPPPPDTLHFVHPTDDTIPSLSLRYNVPAAVLRRHNNITSDHLLSARRTLLVPGTHYPSGVSLSPRPVEGEEEEARRNKIRRWMVATKCAGYEVAELYLAQSGYDLGAAVERYLGDEEWERLHPLEGSGKGKGKGKMGPAKGGTWAAQAAFLKRQGPSR